MGEIACASEGCAHRFWLPDAVERRLRRTGEDFFCPAGHRQHFTAEAHPERKRIHELEEELQQANERADRFRSNWKEALDQQHALTRRIGHLREILYGSSSMYECGACGHQHRFRSDIGREHLEHAVLQVALAAGVDLGVPA